MKTEQIQNEIRSGLLARPEQLSTDTNTGTKRKTNSARGSVYDQITERIVELLQKGTVPWHKPWKAQGGLPRNLVTKKLYRGINVFLLHAMHYESPFWLTFRQALELGGNHPNHAASTIRTSTSTNCLSNVAKSPPFGAPKMFNLCAPI